MRLYRVLILVFGTLFSGLTILLFHFVPTELTAVFAFVLLGISMNAYLLVLAELNNMNDE